MTEQPFGASPAANQRMQDLDCDGMRRSLSQPAGGIVVKPGAIDDAHPAFTKRMSEHALAQAAEWNLTGWAYAVAHLGRREATLRAKPSFRHEHAATTDADRHGSERMLAQSWLNKRETVRFGPISTR